jgi:hypothetical protein
MKIKKKPPVVDFADTAPAYVEDLALIHELGPVTHLKFATASVGYEGKVERRIAAHLIIPRESRLKIAQALLREGELRADATEEDEGISLH